MPNIPPKANRRWKNCFSPFLYRDRNAIERMFGRLKDFRRIATRYDRTPTTSSPPSASPPPSATGYEFRTLVIIILGTFCALVAVIIGYKHKPYTREKFAFRIIILIGGLGSTFVTLVLRGNLSAIHSAASTLFRLPDSTYEPSLSDKILVTIVILGIGFIGLVMHRNWHGPVSTREYYANLAGLKPGVLSGTVAAVRTLPKPVTSRDTYC